MQNQFGLKDFGLYLLVIAALIVALLAMRQDDRRFEEVRQVGVKIGDQERRLAEIARTLTEIQQSGVSVAVGSSRDGAAGTARDESWARPGVPVTWPRPLRFPSDPRDGAGFAEGGEFIELFEAQPATMTPYRYQDVYGRRVIEDRVCQPLGALDPETLELRALLAEAWQYDPDGMWLRAKLNERARFSDGMPVTAEDVRFTFDWVMDPRMDTERFRAVINKIERIEVVSDRVVEFHFTEPKALNKITALRSLPVLPKHFYERFTPDQFNQGTGLLLGSGPYKFETLDPSNQWAPPDDIVLVRNENYWSERPPIDRLRFKVISDNVARLTNYENGTGHMMRASPEQFRTKSESPEFVRRNHTEAWTNMRSGFGFIAWQCGERNGRLTPFHDKRVRRAMTHLLDRDRIRRDFYYGLGEIASSPFPPRSPMINPAIEPWPFDMDRARELLAEAGWVDRDDDGILENEEGREFVFEFTHPQGGTVSPKLAKYLKDQCAAVGVVMNIRVLDWSVMSQMSDDRDFDAMTMMWSHSLPESDPFQLWHTDSTKNRGDNSVQFSDPRVDELIERGRRTLDDGERMRIWHELHAILHDEQPYTFTINAPWIRFISREVSNVNTYPAGLNITEMYFAVPN